MCIYPCIHLHEQKAHPRASRKRSEGLAPPWPIGTRPVVDGRTPGRRPPRAERRPRTRGTRPTYPALSPAHPCTAARPATLPPPEVTARRPLTRPGGRSRLLLGRVARTHDSGRDGDHGTAGPRTLPRSSPGSNPGTSSAQVRSCIAISLPCWCLCHSSPPPRPRKGSVVEKDGAFEWLLFFRSRCTLTLLHAPPPPDFARIALLLRPRCTLARIVYQAALRHDVSALAPPSVLDAFARFFADAVMRASSCTPPAAAESGAQTLVDPGAQTLGPDRAGLRHCAFWIFWGGAHIANLNGRPGLGGALPVQTMAPSGAPLGVSSAPSSCGSTSLALYGSTSPNLRVRCAAGVYLVVRFIASCAAAMSGSSSALTALAASGIDCAGWRLWLRLRLQYRTDPIHAAAQVDDTSSTPPRRRHHAPTAAAQSNPHLLFLLTGRVDSSPSAGTGTRGTAGTSGKGGVDQLNFISGCKTALTLLLHVYGIFSSILDHFLYSSWILSGTDERQEDLQMSCR
ncbi:hypothetical protein C8J57DRAFT_1712702 [Mycena rebaudengoi]|nr:hypothetical protein C8J57DRAFT_1712702 [Mycena rebaudengoi]